MNVEQIYGGCLAQGAYYITSNGEAAIIDHYVKHNPTSTGYKKMK